MATTLNARFNSLQRAEEAATKLRSIRASEVGISQWDNTPYLESYSALTVGIPTGGMTMMPYAVSSHEGNAEQYSLPYLLNAVISDGQQEMAGRIVRECGGDML